jgi:hypothetical protein
VKFKTLKGAALVAATSMLPLSQAAMAEVTISGWINEGVQFYDDGQGSDAVQVNDNGTTLGSRITIAAESEVATGITAGFEVILEPNQTTNTPLIFSNQATFGDHTGNNIGTLGNSLHIGGAWGKVTVGLQSMPTDNIAVLEDPSLTLWSGISPVFRGNGFNIRSGANPPPGTGDSNVANGSVWGDFLNCFTAEGLRGAGGIGIDCNGIYRNGVRYDLPAFGPVTIAIGYANDDIYDIAAKYKGDLGSVKAQLAMGYAINNGSVGQTFGDAENFQLQAGLMHPATGLFGSIAYQHEEASLRSGMSGTNALGGKLSDESDAWWLKVGIKKQWFSLGDTSLSFDYGEYNDQYGTQEAAVGVNGSDVQRIGVAIDQYFGSSLIIYGKWENLDLGVDGVNANLSGVYGNAEDLDTWTLGATYFF